ncbi:PepSY-like domain-containing protein [Chitinophaga sancti]|uniref:PepSY-like domain-containing protein n=1 Tax=Chitinophaga sancti TaxID=1004 RepID=UPI002A75F71B|nr:PepSY-like domain-containing protein [Chitinophaga sancti]WPQ63917.1 PepSY-like domain-containing protein [Chitinophaga sancti]
MRKLVLIFFVALITSGTTFAQKKSAKKTKKVVAKTEMVAPSVVKDSFQQTFTGTDAKWSKNYGGNWVANFTKDDVKTAAEFDKDGKWIATRSNYTEANLPNAVATSVKAKYPAATIKDGWKIERSDVASYYKVNIQDNGTEKAVLINEAGTIAE